MTSPVHASTLRSGRRAGAPRVLVLALAVPLLVVAAGCKDKPPSTPLAEPGPVQSLEGGLTYQQLATGGGEVAKKGDKVTVHYTGRLLDGTQFDSSVERHKPFSFRLGAGHVVKGWDLGLVGMKEGEKRRLTVPPELGYGSQSVGPIPADATLVFDVELLEVN